MRSGRLGQVRAARAAGMTDRAFLPAHSGRRGPGCQSDHLAGKPVHECDMVQGQGRTYSKSELEVVKGRGKEGGGAR